jgi:N-acetylneuraminic acid mutarotase
VVDGKVYAIGGSAERGLVGTNEEYDPVGNAWVFKAAMPTPRDVFAVAVCQNKIYCIGGYSNGGVTGVNEVYDPATDTWETKVPIPTPRGWLQANVVNGQIYLIGGYVPDNSSFGYSISDLNEVYNPSTNSWVTKTSMPTASSDYVSAVFDNEVFVIGGQSKDPRSNLNQIYNPITNRWRLGTPSPSGIRYGYCSAGAVTGVDAPKRIYVLGETCHLWEGEPQNSVRVYDPKSDEWTFGADVPTKRQGFGVAVVDDVLYVVGGYTVYYPDWFSYSVTGGIITRYATVERYTPFGYGTVPPDVRIVAPLWNQTCVSGNVSLAFTVNKQASWMGYSLDGQDNVTVAGNTTISGLQSGLHNVTVYARDGFENTGASEAVSFSVEAPFPTALVAAASSASVIMGVGLLAYFKKRHH